jgi:hypothetical protein
VSLRSEIHAAIDEVARPAPALAREVLDFVRADGRRRFQAPRRAIRWSYRMRPAGALVAAALVVALIATLIVGGRVWRDLGDPNNSTSPAGQAQLGKLHARPLHLPVVQPGAACPDGPYSNVVSGSGGPPLALGVGPAYVYVGARTPSSWGTYFDLELFVEPQISGLVLVRGYYLDTRLPVVFAGDSAAGKLVYEDTVTSEDPVTGDNTLVTVDQRPELVLEPSHQDTQPEQGGLRLSHDPFKVWWAWLAVVKGATPCLGLQIDGPGFSEVVVISKVA